ncbi:MAG TPA: 16S rRNA (uracil(1498)-N(3))-methyltransferase [Ktedonobacteraceae bacterium]|jgi:16S rRNA (uracil1498-N3)-methyltransferase|nr:16S rRNA (uracil(1498)-N(3))-methyltransferase [Ktedonobacteraceae bacterium]
MHRFFVSPELLKETNTTISLPKELAHQVRDVLRLNPGEQLLLLDNSGEEVLASIAAISKTAVDAHLLERRPGKSESPVRIILCQGLLKSARFEWILEKGTELGVSTFSPILCRRSMAGLEGTRPSKIARWKRIIQEAAEQCGRARLPELLPIRPLMRALNGIPAGAIALMPWEEEQNCTLRQALTFYKARQSAESRLDTRTTATVVLFIGPEGGLMAEEVALAQRSGVQVVSLGSRILRAETAALAAVANVMYELDG